MPLNADSKSGLPIVVFDGVCNFCNGTVNFVIRQDKNATLRYATLQSDVGQQLLQQYGLPQTNFKSFVLIEGGKAYTRSAAVLRLSRHLAWYWRWSQIFWLVPKFVRDAVYDLVAQNRYRWFSKKSQCMIPTPEMRSRFLNIK